MHLDKLTLLSAASRLMEESTQYLAKAKEYQRCRAVLAAEECNTAAEIFMQASAIVRSMCR